MNKKYNALLAGLMCIGLGACASGGRTSAMNDSKGELYGETAGGGAPAEAVSGISSLTDGAGTAGATGGSTASGSSGMAGSSGTSGISGSAGTDGASGTAGQSAGAATAGSPSWSAGTSGASGGTDMTQSAGMTSYGVIQSIDAIPRSQAFGTAASSGMSSGVGSQSGSSGAMTGSGSSGDLAYRVTVRMDDGSTKAIIQESRPSFQTGDRVRMASNPLQRY